MSDFKFRSSEVEELPTWAALPDGKHLVEIVSCELKDTAKGGKRLVVGMRALEGELDGMQTMVGLNVICPSSAKAEAISRSQLKTLSVAVGKPDWDDCEVLVGNRCIAHLKFKTARHDAYTGDDYPASNEIRRWYPQGIELSAAAMRHVPPSQTEFIATPDQSSHQDFRSSVSAQQVPQDRVPEIAVGGEKVPDTLPWNNT